MGPNQNRRNLFAQVKPAIYRATVFLCRHILRQTGLTFQSIIQTCRHFDFRVFTIIKLTGGWNINYRLFYQDSG
jgi:hypothetical protein